MRNLHKTILKNVLCLMVAGISFITQTYSQTISGPTCVLPGIYPFTPYQVSGNLGSNSGAGDKWCITGGTIAGSTACYTNPGNATCGTVSWNPGITQGTLSYYRPGTATTPVATLTVNIINPGTLSPSSTTVPTGTNVPVTITGTTVTAPCITPAPAISYQWQKQVSGTYTDIPGATSKDLLITESFSQVTNIWRKVIVNGTTAYNLSSPSFIVPQTPHTPGTITPVTQNLTNTQTPALLSTATMPGGGSCSGSYTYNWQSSADNVTWADISGATATTYQPPVLAATRYYRLRVGCGSLQNYIFTNVATINITVSNPFVAGNVSPGNITTAYNSTIQLNSYNVSGGCSGTNTYTYAWEKSIDNGLSFQPVPGATANSLSSGPLTMTTTYRVAVTVACTGETLYSTTAKITILLPADNDNKILQRTFTKAGITDINEANVIADPYSVNQITQYFDGLGRLKQVVSRNASPSLKDIVQPVVYNELGLETTKYLPYADISSQDGLYKANALTNQQNFYGPSGWDPSVAEIASPFSVAKLESSPLRRLYEQGAPGTVWQPAVTRDNTTGRTLIVETTTNDQVSFNTATIVNNAGSRKVALYTINSSSALTRSATPFYASNQLFVSITKDENWLSSNGCFGTTEEYKDKLGRVVMKRTYNLKGAVAEMLSTYYIYDKMGTLAFVLPPGAEPDMATGVPSATVISNFCYQYKYDNRNRLVEKKLPGKDWEYVIYNKLDQVIATQDALHRNKSPLQEASFIKYNALGQVVMTGVCTLANTTAAGTNYRTAIQSAANAQTTLWETRINAGGATPNTDYTVASMPTANFAPLVINYYGGYDYIPGMPGNYTPAAGEFNVNTNGLLTATRTAILNTPANTLLNVNYYNEDGRVTYIYSQHYKSGENTARNYDEIVNTYDFTGQVTTMTRNHYIKGTDPVIPELKLTIANRYIYDHRGRRTKNWQTLTGTPRTLLAQSAYNEIGQLKSKYQHITDTVANNFKQQIEYFYNERGWLKRINDPAVAPTATKVFGMELFYNDGANKEFNGNIGNVDWRTKVPAGMGLNDQLQKYAYSYDDLNRLTLGKYNTGLTNTDKYNEELTYDVMGNISSLKRKDNPAAAVFLNDIGYNYTISGVGNKLWRTTEGSTNFNYTYDLNGNVISDSRNLVTGITYNLLNLPQTVTRTSGNITYTYDAAGRKLRKTGGGITREYIGGIEYDGANIEFITTEEGRALAIASSPYNYEYYLKDHLGNTRATVKQEGSIVQVQDYYPFGKGIASALIPSPNNRYKYNGKEEQETGQYDYGARFYDPIIGRWTSVDLLSENSRRWSTFNYCLNNPLRFIDPDGMSTRDVIIEGDELEERAKAFSELQKSVSGQLKLSMDGKGNVTSKTEEGVTLSKESEQLKAAIDNHSIKVHLNATSDTKGPLFGEAFMGNTVTDEVVDGKKVVDAKQDLNPNITKMADDFYGKPGANTLHGVTEAYKGALISQSSGTSAEPALRGVPNPIYTDAHAQATAQSGEIKISFVDSSGNTQTSVIGAASISIYVQKGNDALQINSLPIPK